MDEHAELCDNQIFLTYNEPLPEIGSYQNIAGICNKERTIFGMKRYVQKGNKTYQRGFFTGKKRAVVGYTNKGQALVNRSLGGKVGTAAMSGPGFGAMTYMGTKDEHGNKLSQGKRIARGGGETLMWSATPHAAGIYYGGKIVSELFKHNKNKNPHQQILKN